MFTVLRGGIVNTLLSRDEDTDTDIEPNQQNRDAPNATAMIALS